MFGGSVGPPFIEAVGRSDAVVVSGGFGGSVGPPFIEAVVAGAIQMR